MIARSISVCALITLAWFGPASAQIEKPVRPSKKVLVELYTSQGCNSCPSANDLLGQLARLGYDSDKIVPIAFHVDYFNEPWTDPFSRKEFSQREMAYNTVLKRTDLYFTPMMMVDGQIPMLGSNRVEALKAIKKSLSEEPGASLKLTLDDKKSIDRNLKVTLSPLSSEIQGRQLMIGVTITEGPISTKVPSGENAGQTLVEPFVVRSFAYKTARLTGSESKTLEFPLKLAERASASSTRVSAFVQDWDNGRVYQAESIRWVAEPTKK